MTFSFMWDRNGTARCSSTATRSTSESRRGRVCLCGRRQEQKASAAARTPETACCWGCATSIAKYGCPPECVCRQEVVLHYTPAKTRCSGRCGGKLAGMPKVMVLRVLQAQERALHGNVQISIGAEGKVATAKKRPRQQDSDRVNSFLFVARVPRRCCFCWQQHARRAWIDQSVYPLAPRCTAVWDEPGVTLRLPCKHQ